MSRRHGTISDPTSAQGTANLVAAELNEDLSQVLNGMPDLRVDLFVAAVCFAIPVPDLARAENTSPETIHHRIREVFYALNRLRPLEVDQLDQYIDDVHKTGQSDALRPLIDRLGIEIPCCRHCRDPLHLGEWKGYFQKADRPGVKVPLSKSGRARSGRPRRYCSPACRKAAHRARRRLDARTGSKPPPKPPTNRPG